MILGLISVLFWVTGFDVIYACRDVEFDLLREQPGCSASANAWACQTPLRLAAVSHLVMVACLVALGWSVPLGRIYFAGVAGIAALLVYEHTIVRPDDLSRLNYAFFQINVVVSLGLLAFGLADLLS